MKNILTIQNFIALLILQACISLCSCSNQERSAQQELKPNLEQQQPKAGDEKAKKVVKPIISALKINKYGMNEKGVIWLKGSFSRGAKVLVNGDAVKHTANESIITFRLPNHLDNKEVSLRIILPTKGSTKYKLLSKKSSRSVSIMN